MKCGKCSKSLKLDEANWIRITCPAGGKIQERPLCDKCAFKIADDCNRGT